MTDFICTTAIIGFVFLLVIVGETAAVIVNTVYSQMNAFRFY